MDIPKTQRGTSDTPRSLSRNAWNVHKSYILDLLKMLGKGTNYSSNGDVLVMNESYDRKEKGTMNKEIYIGS